MSDKNISLLTLAVASIGTIVVCVIAYKLNNATSAIDNLQRDPLGTIKSIL